MKEAFKHYRMKITAMSPVHIGNGMEIGKKEYIYHVKQHRVLIPDIGKMYMDFRKCNLTRAYEEYILKNNRDDLGSWMERQRYPMKRCDLYRKYELDAGDAVMTDTSGRNRGLCNITAFVKDAYGKPYVPGSSIKGMIRTALLAYQVSQNRQAYRRELGNIENGVQQRASRTQYLKRETGGLETSVFHTLKRTDKPFNALNSVMTGLIIGDSDPIDEAALTLCQKIDVSLDGKEHTQPVLKESLRPGTEIYFDLTLDTTICSFTMEDIMDALEYYNRAIYRLFYTRFHRGSPDAGSVWLGSGTGFASKTVMYPVFETRAVPLVDAVFRNTLGKKYEEHKHDKDKALNIAPHMCKCTRYHGQLYDVGLCRMEELA